MTTFQAVILGLIQGLTELLPISSSAHLALTPWLLGWDDPGLAFDVALHLGTLVAILWYFRKEWVALARAAYSIVRKRRIETVEEKRVLFLVIATIPAAIGGLILEEKAETVFRSPKIIGATLIVMGILLWAVDRIMARHRELKDMRYLDAIVIGLAQVLALVPGVSRSGSTITAGRALQLDRQTAAVFSFLMSMPITAAAVILKVPDAIRDTGVTVPLVAGVVAAGVSSWLAIAVLLRYVSRHSYGIFGAYRIALGAFVFYLIATRG